LLDSRPRIEYGASFAGMTIEINIFLALPGLCYTLVKNTFKKVSFARSR